MYRCGSLLRGGRAHFLILLLLPGLGSIFAHCAACHHAATRRRHPPPPPAPQLTRPSSVKAEFRSAMKESPSVLQTPPKGRKVEVGSADIYRSSGVFILTSFHASSLIRDALIHRPNINISRYSLCWLAVVHVEPFTTGILKQFFKKKRGFLVKMLWKLHPYV